MRRWYMDCEETMSERKFLAIKLRNDKLFFFKRIRSKYFIYLKIEFKIPI